MPDTATLMQYLLYFMELVAAATGFIFWRRMRHTYWKWFPVYLLLIGAGEAGAHFSSDRLNADINRFFLIPLGYLFFYWLYYRYFQASRLRFWALGGASVYLLALVADNTVLKNQSFAFQTLSGQTGILVLLVLIVVFFLKFSSEDSILQYRHSQMFWVSAGLLLFYVGTFPLFALWNNLWAHHGRFAFAYWKVMMVLNYIMYALFACSFVWSKERS
jgi:hypothetical protein